MNIYHVVQWGNPFEGGNGEDGQYIFAAKSFDDAVSFGEQHFKEWNAAMGKSGYMRDRIHIVHFMGRNDMPDGDPVLLLSRWQSSSCNFGKMPYWCRQLNSDIWEEFT